MSWLALVGVLLGGVGGGLAYRPVTEMLVRAGAVRPNYEGRSIPVAGGLVFVLPTLLGQAVQFGLARAIPGFGYPLGLLAVAAFTVAGFAFLGLVDDLLGSRETGGFRGHFRVLLREGRLTSGALKALGGVVVAAWPALAGLPGSGLWPGTVWDWALAGFVNLLLVALSANAVNLLDLRPGRALKGFLLLLALGLAFGRGRHPGWVWMAPLVGAALVYGRYDLAGEVMMGDTGANVLGAMAGVLVAWTGSFRARLLWLAALCVFHAYTERASLSAAIERVALLRWLDRLGRREERGGGEA